MTYNGVRVGRVSDVVPVLNDVGSSEIALHYDIEGRMRQAVIIGDNTRFSISGSLLGGGGAFNHRIAGCRKLGATWPSGAAGIESCRSQYGAVIGESIDRGKPFKPAFCRTAIAGCGGEYGRHGRKSEVVAENREAINEAIVGMRDMTQKHPRNGRENREEGECRGKTSLRFIGKPQDFGQRKPPGYTQGYR